MPTKKKQSRAASLVSEINSTLGTDVRLGSDPSFEIVRIPTGSLVLDRITGGGFALGRHVELFGDENACKSYIAYRTMALSQQRGNLCAIVDPEHSFDGGWFRHLGGSDDDLLSFHPANAEEAIAVMMTLAKHAEDRSLEVITIDSVASLIPAEELERDPRDEDRIAGQARMMSRALRRITAVNRRTLFLWTNQERTNIGVRFGNPKTTSGGRALRFYATTRVEVRRGGVVKAKRPVAKDGRLVQRDMATARWIQCRVEKDKSTRPYREGSFLFDSDVGGIDQSSEILHLGLEDGLITLSGNTYIYDDDAGKQWKGTRSKFQMWLSQTHLGEELIAGIVANTERAGDYE
jgi:recombination protein RecA